MDVRMPDGTIIRNVPPGTTKQQLLEKYSRMSGVPTQAAPPTAPPVIEPPPETPMGEQFMRGAGITARGMLPSALGAMAGAPAGPPGMIAGSMLLPAAELAAQGYNMLVPESFEVPSPTGAVQNLMTQAGLPVPETMGERAMESAAGALTGTAGQLYALPKLAASAASPVTRETAEMLAYGPGRQLAAAPVAAGTGQAVTEATGSPLQGLLAGSLAAAPFSMRLGYEQKGPSREQLQITSTDAFERARASGVEIPEQQWSGIIQKIKSGLKGFNPKKDRDIAAQLQTMEARPAVPGESFAKNWDDLESYRSQIQGMQASADPNTRRLASELKYAFDEAILEAPLSEKGGRGVSAWADARNAYARMSKGQIFDDMKEDAALSLSKFTQSGYENALASELRKLASNDKRMRMFTASERAEIRKAARGSSLQNITKFFGRFAPTSSVPLIASGAAASALGPTAGAALGAGGAASRLAAQKIREGSVDRLADIMRSGFIPEAPPILQRQLPTARGLLAPIYGVPPEEERYGLLSGGL